MHFYIFMTHSHLELYIIIDIEINFLIDVEIHLGQTYMLLKVFKCKELSFVLKIS